MSYPMALALFGLTSIAILMAEIMYGYLYFGFGFGWSSNRPVNPERSAFGVRLQRTWQNQVESAAYIVPALVAAMVLQVEGGGMAAMLIVIGRAAYAPLYLSGIPFIRVPAFVLGTFSTLYLIYLVLTSVG
jgi:uncharacterized MAPEG superfamily protein